MMSGLARGYVPVAAMWMIFVPEVRVVIGVRLTD